jgi:rubrerythrin
MATAENLQDAFAGESQANRKYTAFARKAEAEGFKNIARLFRAVAEAETVHALSHLRVMGGVKSTAENVKAALAGETYEIEKMYPPMVAEAERANLSPAKTSFRNALDVEKDHAALYAQALAAVQAGKDVELGDLWVCGICGHTVAGDPGDRCPICGASRERFSKVG